MEEQILEVSGCIADFREAVRLYKATGSGQRTRKMAQTADALSKAFAALVKDSSSSMQLADTAQLLSSCQRPDGIFQVDFPAVLAEVEQQVALLLSSLPMENVEGLAGSEFTPAPPSSLLPSWPLPEMRLPNIHHQDEQDPPVRGFHNIVQALHLPPSGLPLSSCLTSSSGAPEPGQGQYFPCRQTCFAAWVHHFVWHGWNPVSPFFFSCMQHI